MSRKRSTGAARKHTRPIARWGRYLLAGALLLAVLVAVGVADRMLLATSASPEPSAAAATGSAHTLYAHGDRLRPLVEATVGAQTLNIYGPGGQIIAQATRDDQGNEGVRYLLTEHLGSTRAALDADGNAVARYEYGPHGETALAAGAAAAEARYRYTGHPYDEEQGLYETPARGYDPTTGRFLSVDPQRQDASPYVYAGNNPVGFLDPTGGAQVPFFMRSGFWGQRENFASAGFTELEVKDRLAFVRDVGDALGRAKGQNIQDATVTFGSDPDGSPLVMNDTKRFLQGYAGGDREFQYDERLYWLIGDDDKIRWPIHFKEAVPKIRATATVDGAYDSPNFAGKIVLVDLTKKPGSTAIDTVKGYLQGIGFESDVLKPSDVLLAKSEKRAKSRSPMITPKGTTVPQSIGTGQQGPDALGGAGPGPPRQPTSTTNRGRWQELIPEGPPGLLEILTTFGEPRVSD